MSATQYRAYHVGDDDRFRAGFNIDCVDDQEAIQIAKRLVNIFDVELWQGCRMVARLQPTAESIANRYRHEAEKCRRQADEAVSSHLKEGWLEVAADWVKLAESAERRWHRFS
jgi:hypothetical protein